MPLLVRMFPVRRKLIGVSTGDNLPKTAQADGSNCPSVAEN